MLRTSRSLALVIAVLLAPLIANITEASSALEGRQGGAVTATVIADAPIYGKVGFTTPLRVAAVGTRLTVVGSQGDWTQVQFNDPQWGQRTGWISTQLIQVERSDLLPMDLSVGADAPEPARARSQGSTQMPEPATRSREGFWFNIGMGIGSLGCENCSERDTGASGGLVFGGALNDRVLLGVGSTGLAKNYDGDLLTVGTLDGRIRFYPSRSSGFFLNAGLGLGTYSFLGESELGFGAMLGLGWDIRVGRNVSLTPFWNGSGISNENIDANFGQIGLGITIH